MPRPEHPHIEEVKGWIADDFRENEGPKSGTAYHDKAVALWGVKDAPALRTVANALRDVREATRLGKRENNAMSYWLKEEPAPPKPVESESLTAGECPECLGEIWDDECQCPVEDIPIATGVVESKDREVAEADATIQNLVEMVNDNPKLKSVADTLATEIADQIIEGNNQDLAINFKDIALPDFTTREDQ